MAVLGSIAWWIPVGKTVLLPEKSDALLVCTWTAVSNLQTESLAGGIALTVEENHDDVRAVSLFYRTVSIKRPGISQNE